MRKDLYGFARSSSGLRNEHRENIEQPVCLSAVHIKTVNPAIFLSN